MPKPTPAVELVVNQVSDRILFITAHSHDAAEWLTLNAPDYGKMFKADFESHSTLFVADGYNVADVVLYLDSYNRPDEPGAK